jgi:hypothetical protein
MPPLGTELVDREAFALLSRWIAELQASQEQTKQEDRGK